MKICISCGECFHSKSQIEAHAILHKHSAFECNAIGCNARFVLFNEFDAHCQHPHVAGHLRLGTSTPMDCVECQASFRSKGDLHRHAKERQHRPYGCECGALFSRLDVFYRHLESVDESDPKYPCKYCRRHRGTEGFRRRDHLMQHIRNYHHHEADEADETTTRPSSKPKSRLRYSFPVCSHPECPLYRDETFKQLPRSVQLEKKPFSSLSGYTKHMREEHNECSFPCDVAGCNRVGRRGYFREKDFMKHRKEQHPDAPPYHPSKRDVRHRCTIPGCGRSLNQSSISDHYRFVHGEWRTHRIDSFPKDWKQSV